MSISEELLNTLKEHFCSLDESKLTKKKDTLLTSKSSKQKFKKED